MSDTSARVDELFGRPPRSAATGNRVLPAGWLDHARTHAAHDDENGCDHGRHWWMWPEVPGSLAAHGHEGQCVVVVPERELVVVHLGKTEAAASDRLRARLRELIESY